MGSHWKRWKFARELLNAEEDVARNSEAVLNQKGAISLEKNLKEVPEVAFPGEGPEEAE